jgi:hypothetical protein
MSKIILVRTRACPREAEIVEKLLLQMKDLDPDLNLDECEWYWHTMRDTHNINMKLDLHVSYDKVEKKNGIMKLSRVSLTTSHIMKVNDK